MTAAPSVSAHLLPTMFFERPPRVAVFSAALWALHVVLLALALWWLPSPEGSGEYLVVLALAVSALAYGAFMLRPWLRAMRWQLRMSSRPSAAQLAERQRIAGDLHDTVGGQLLMASLMADARHGQDHALNQTLAQCLLELRLVVDSLALSDDDLMARMGRLRHRVQPLLEQRGIAIEWSVESLDAAPAPLQGACASEIYAVVQQALVNVLQHAHASQVRVRIQFEADSTPSTAGKLSELASRSGLWRFVVADDGVGALALWAREGDGPEDPLVGGAGAAPPLGHGVHSMAERARRIGATLVWGPVPGGGTCVCLEMPARA